MVWYMGILFSQNVKYHISGPWGELAFDIECENRLSRDLGILLLASDGDELLMPRVLFFSQINISRVSHVENSNDFQ